MSKRLTKNSILVVSENQVSADVSPDPAGQMIILDLQNGTYYELNETGTCVWKLMQKPVDIQTMLDTLLAKYEVDAKQCESDLLLLLDDLITRGLVELKNGENP
ncbi:MAG: PqqD family peptide modification chaperone [Gammaproteobacteria bacterium]